MSDQNNRMTSANEKMELLKNLLLDLIQKLPGSESVAYANKESSWQLLLEIVGCYLDHIPMKELPAVIKDKASDLATFRINWVKNTAIEEMKEPIPGIPLFPDYPEEFSQEIKTHETQKEEPKTNPRTQLVENIETIKKLEKELSSAKEIINELAAERDALTVQIEEIRNNEPESPEDVEPDYDPEATDTPNGPDPEELEAQMKILESEVTELNKAYLKVEKERDYWKLQFEELEAAHRQDAARNNAAVTKKYKLSKLKPVDFMNNLIATEPYSIEQLSYIQYCLIQNIPIDVISKCVSAAFPVEFMEDYIQYYCRKAKLGYRPYNQKGNQ